MTVRVSVVVPVYNPGRHIDDCIASILRQSLPVEEFEAIFVDDGSTDGTGERLDALASQHTNVRVIHIPNSGWPGRPRNLGIEAASGEYVYFVDNDDWIGEEALERLDAMARRNGSDIVIGKVVGHGRKISYSLFRVSRDRAELSSDPLLSLLTPHKLFRKAFLDQHGIRFPEGRRRLEDHPFVLRAYFLAGVISVLADYPCYHWVKRTDATNASLDRFDPQSYFENVREVLDIVEEHTEAGPARDRLLRHWYRGKVVRRLGGNLLLRYPPDYRQEFFGAARDLALERFGPGVSAGLPTRLRVRSRLLVDGRLDALVALAAAEGEIRAVVTSESVSWHGEELRLCVEGFLSYGDGRPMAFRRTGDRAYWNLPVDLDADIAAEDLDATADLRGSRLDVLVRSRGDRTEFLLPGSFEREQPDPDPAEIRLRGTGRFDPGSAAAGRALATGVWDVVVRVATGYWDAAARLPVMSAATLAPGVVGAVGRIVIPYATLQSNLSIDLDQATRSLLAVAPAAAGEVALSPDKSTISLALQLPSAHGAGCARVPAEIQLRPTGRFGQEVTAAAALVAGSPDDPVVRLESRLVVTAEATRTSLGPGSWQLTARLGHRAELLRLVLNVDLRRGPKLRAADSGAPARRAGAALSHVRLVARRFRRLVLRAGTVRNRGGRANNS